MRHKDDVTDPSHFAEIMDLPEAGEEELALMTKIVDMMTTDLNLRAYHAGYKERIEALIKSKMKGEIAKVGGEEAKPIAKSMMEVLRATAE
jgi:non-homologous end joining protein Ku